MKSQFLSQPVLLSLSLSFASSLAAGERRLSLEPWAGKDVTIELVNEPTGWMCEAAVWHDIRITANNGTL